MKLMDIDSDTLGIPDTDYDARVTLSSAEFSRIVRDLSLLGESVRIEVSKEGVRFAADGEAANGNVLLKPTEHVGKVEKKEDAPAEEDNEEEKDDEDEDAEVKVKKEKTEKAKVKKEKNTEEDVEMDDEEAKDKEDLEPEEDEDEEQEDSRKRKKKVCLVSIYAWTRLTLRSAISWHLKKGQDRVFVQRQGQEKGRRRGRSRHGQDRDEPTCFPDLFAQVSGQLFQESISRQPRPAHDEQRRATTRK